MVHNFRGPTASFLKGLGRNLPSPPAPASKGPTAGLGSGNSELGWPGRLGRFRSSTAGPDPQATRRIWIFSPASPPHAERHLSRPNPSLEGRCPDERAKSERSWPAGRGECGPESAGQGGGSGRGQARVTPKSGWRLSGSVQGQEEAGAAPPLQTACGTRDPQAPL